MGFFDRNPVGRLITRITNDVDVLNELFTAGVVSIFGDIFTLSGIVLVMLWLNWKLALVCFSVVPLLFVVTMIFKTKVRGSYRWVRRSVAKINAFLQENITGMSVVQIFVQEKRKLHQFDERNSEYLKANLLSISYYAIFYPVVNMLGVVAIALILWYGGNQVLGETLTLGALVAFIQYSERFYKPISDLSEKVNILQSAMASSERIFTLQDTQPEIAPPSQPLRPAKMEGRIEFKNVSFAYNEDTPGLEEYRPESDPGRERWPLLEQQEPANPPSSICYADSTTSRKGKSAWTEFQFKSWTWAFCVSRSPLCFRMPFSSGVPLKKTSVCGGDPSDSRKWRERPGRFTHMNSFKLLQDGYTTPVAERGAGLSVGQKQLLAFARALAHDPQLLVLDEATSSVDTETELLIQDALDQLMKDRTCLIIAHRLSTIQNCDRIIVLHKGEIREEGSHFDLLKNRGIYYKLYQLQYKNQVGQLSRQTG